MASEASGVALIGRMLACLAEAPGRTVSALAQALLIPRSTAFELVRGLEAAGLAERDAGGYVHVERESSRLGFASLGLGRLLGPAEALIPILRDDTDATASLLVRCGEQSRVLLRRRAPWDTAQEGAQEGVRLPVLDAALETRVGPPVFVRLQLRPHAGEAERASAAASLARTAEALSHALSIGPKSGYRFSAKSDATTATKSDPILLRSPPMDQPTWPKPTTPS